MVAKLISDNAELIEEVINNPDNLGYDEITRIDDGSEYGIEALTERGVDSLREFIADVRIWDGGIREFLISEHCDPDVIERIMGAEAKR